MALSKAVNTFIAYLTFAAIYLVGFCLPLWIQDEFYGSNLQTTFGIWMSCSEFTCLQYAPSKQMPVSLWLTQTFATIGIVLMIGAFPCFILWITERSIKPTRRWYHAALALVGLAGVFGLGGVGCFIWFSYEEDGGFPLGVAFFMCMVSSFAQILTASVAACVPEQDLLTHLSTYSTA